MLPHARSLRSRLIAVVVVAGVVVAAASACTPTPTHEHCYMPAATGSQGPPPLPCLAQGDRRLPALLEPSCAKDFSVESGPTQKLGPADQPICCYTTEYETASPCAIDGRPLFIDGALVHAQLVLGAAWT